MSNEIDLDWLARNVHKWKSGYDLAVVQHGSEEIYVTWPSVCSSGITKKQWLARRAELQNKPSWEDAPEWAEWIAKDSPDKDEISAWWWYADKPVAMKNKWQVSTDGRAMMAAGCNCDIADWRDTLERRPVDLSEPAVTELLQGSVDNVLAAVLELKSDGFKFEPLTSIEDNQEQGMNQENGWLERGELPPVGTVCEYTLGAGAPWYQCEIKYVIRDVGVVMKRIPCGSEQYCGLLQKYPVSFRPIRTDRDKAIEEMIKAISGGGTGKIYIMECAGKLYDAGYRKEQK